MKRFLGVLLLLWAIAQISWLAYDLSTNGFKEWKHLCGLVLSFFILAVGLGSIRGDKGGLARGGPERNPESGSAPDRIITPFLTDSFPFKEGGRLSAAGCFLFMLTIASGGLFLFLGSFFVAPSDFLWIVALPAGSVAFGTCVYLVGKRLLWHWGLSVRRRDPRIIWRVQALQKFTALPDERAESGADDQRKQSERKKWREGTNEGLINEGDRRGSRPSDF